MGRRHKLFAVALAIALAAVAPARGAEESAQLAERYGRQVDMRLDVPPVEQAGYALRLDAALAAAGLADLPPQYFLLVDRSPAVQAALLYWRAAPGAWRFVGASPVSTGRRGGFEYFLTPPGVFAHTPANPDFRAEGTKNEQGVRGYGARGLRVFDFGWVEAERTWGEGGRSPMRLQVHATDPDLLEGRLGQPHSKGCIRIPATLNRFLDHYGVLDAEYERRARAGERFWVLLPGREPVAFAGRYLVIVDSQRRSRPAWSPWPPRRERMPAKRPAADPPPRAGGGDVVSPAC